MRQICPNCDQIFQTKKSKLHQAFKEGSSMAGRFCSTGCASKYMRENKLGTYDESPREWVTGKNNYQWKGDRASYGTKHDWIRKWGGTPKKCEHCGTTDPSKRYEWATISGEHKRDLKDWKRLCKKCHVDYDDSYRGLREYLKKPVRKKQSNNKSGFKNVRLTAQGRYRAYITYQKKQIQLGNFDTGEEAYEAYKAKALELYGEY